MRLSPSRTSKENKILRGSILFDIVNTFSLYPLNVMGSVNMHVCMYVYIQADMHMYVHVYRQACICVHVYIQAGVHMCACLQRPEIDSGYLPQPSN